MSKERKMWRFTRSHHYKWRDAAIFPDETSVSQFDKTKQLILPREPNIREKVQMQEPTPKNRKENNEMGMSFEAEPQLKS